MPLSRPEGPTALEKIMVGLVILLIPTLIIVGDIEELIEGIFVIVVCTAGLGGLAIMVAAFLAGEAAFWISSFLRGRKQPSFSRQAQVSQAVSDYVSQAKVTGMSNSQIKEALRAAGWAEDVIKKAIR